MSKAKYIFKNIIAEMARNGDTIQSLSKKLGIGYQTLSSRLKGERSFELTEIYKIMQIYGRDFETLFSPTENQAS